MAFSNSVCLTIVVVGFLSQSWPASRIPNSSKIALCHKIYGWWYLGNIRIIVVVRLLSQPTSRIAIGVKVCLIFWNFLDLSEINCNLQILFAPPCMKRCAIFWYEILLPPRKLLFNAKPPRYPSKDETSIL